MLPVPSTKATQEFGLCLAITAEAETETAAEAEAVRWEPFLVRLRTWEPSTRLLVCGNRLLDDLKHRSWPQYLAPAVARTPPALGDCDAARPLGARHPHGTDAPLGVKVLDLTPAAAMVSGLSGIGWAFVLLAGLAAVGLESGPPGSAPMPFRLPPQSTIAGTTATSTAIPETESG